MHLQFRKKKTVKSLDLLHHNKSTNDLFYNLRKQINGLKLFLIWKSHIVHGHFLKYNLSKERIAVHINNLSFYNVY